MFKVEKAEFVNKTFRVEKSLLERLESIAQKEKVSLNTLVVQCCEYALEHMNDTQDHA